MMARNSNLNLDQQSLITSALVGAHKETSGSPVDAQELAEKHAAEIGVEVIPFQMMVFVDEHDKYMPIDDVPEGTKYSSISGTELRARLAEGRELPEWFTFRKLLMSCKKPIVRGTNKDLQFFSPG
jgi:sulfate adenylyltransferase